jgi:adenylate cyclase
MMMGFITSVYDNFVLHTSFSVGPAKDYSFFVSIATNMGAGLVGALLGGSLLVFM